MTDLTLMLARPATWTDRCAEYRRLRSAGFSRIESVQFARWLEEVPDDVIRGDALMAHTCNCVNQCPACGQCCQFDCGHRRSAGTWTAPHTGVPYQPGKITPESTPTLPTGTIRLVSVSPLTEEQVRRIVRDALDEGLTELARLRAALKEIASRPTVERNPDGDDQAAASMRLIAKEALDA